MRLALALGARHLGLTWPNPSVGAVVVADRPGGPLHRRRRASRSRAGGRTPSAMALRAGRRGGARRDALCHAGALLASRPDAALRRRDHRRRASRASSRRIEDPDPRVARPRPRAACAAAGIAVTTGVLRGRGRARSIAAISCGSTAGRPAVTLKLARTADGYAAGARRRAPAASPGRSREGARPLMRAHADADHGRHRHGRWPTIRCSPCGCPGLEERSPVRVVLDTALRLPPSAQLGADGRATCRPGSSPPRRAGRGRSARWRPRASR